MSSWRCGICVCIAYPEKLHGRLLRLCFYCFPEGLVKTRTGTLRRRYQLVTENKSWRDASRYCGNVLDSKLVVIGNENDVFALQEYTNKLQGQLACRLIFIMAALCNRGAIIFLPCDFFLLLSIYLSFSPRLISAAMHRLDI